MEATVAADEGDRVVLDANHPLAGQTLRLDIELLEVRHTTAVGA
jgi:FKBP-type peptidyl-prolyl cis-trans isomerase 2